MFLERKGSSSLGCSFKHPMPVFVGDSDAGSQGSSLGNPWTLPALGATEGDYVDPEENEDLLLTEEIRKGPQRPLLPCICIGKGSPGGMNWPGNGRACWGQLRSDIRESRVQQEPALLKVLELGRSEHHVEDGNSSR